jgi:hypothetical protein
MYRASEVDERVRSRSLIFAEERKMLRRESVAFSSRMTRAALCLAGFVDEASE